MQQLLEFEFIKIHDNLILTTALYSSLDGGFHSGVMLLYLV